MTVDGTMLFVGGGKMASALIAGLLDSGTPGAAIHVVEPDADGRTRLGQQGVRPVSEVEGLPGDLSPRVVILAVKPQAMDDVLPPYARFVGPETVFLSVAAGRTIASLARHLDDNAAIVRSIPNTPAAVRRGMTVLCANDRVTAEQRTACDELLRGVGDTGWVADEDLMDAATAVSGSGPAYVFHMIESLARAGVDAGLPEDLAGRLAVNTVAGAGALAQQSDEAPSQLRRNVTSPGGTTEAALDVLMTDDALAHLFSRAVAAATRRSKELAG